MVWTSKPMWAIRAITVAVAAAGVQAIAAPKPPDSQPAVRLEADVSMRSIPVDVRFSGARVVIFGSVDPVGVAALDPRSFDIVVILKAPSAEVTVRRKSNVGGIWLNTQAVTFEQAPRYYAVVSTRPLEVVATKATLADLGIGLEQVPIVATAGEPARADTAVMDDFRKAAIALGVRRKQYVRLDNAISFVGKSLFRGEIDLPADVPVADLQVNVYLFRGGEVLGRRDSRVRLAREGFEDVIYAFAQDRPLAYGIATVGMAVAIGLLSSFIVGLRRP
jgi:uncharacterized protein (TIGR02186 family)